MQRFAGKVAIVTGAASGIGRATAIRLAGEGARVVVADIDVDGGTAAAQECGGVFRPLDISQESPWRTLIAWTVEQHGALHVLVNNACIGGTDRLQTPDTAELGDLHRLVDVNIGGVVLGCKHAIPAMIAAGGGAIVNVSSITAMLATPHVALYGATKAAIRQYSRSVALFCAMNGSNIRCNSVYPGMIDTPMLHAMLGGRGDLQAGLARAAGNVPLRRIGAPAEVAACIAFLASDDSRYVTGAELAVDGGLSLG